MTATKSPPEEIAVIGGGLGGCMTALMLARQRTQDGQPRYHVTLIEAQDKLFNGASLIASRLHLGGEYPKHAETAKHCLHGAVVWKLLMPDHIYTPVKPMKFLVAAPTENHADDKKRLTVNDYLTHYAAIRDVYEDIFKEVRDRLFKPKPGPDDHLIPVSVKAETDKTAETKAEVALFGAPKDFFHTLQEKDLSAEYGFAVGDIAGGFQSQERGLNVPKYLSMLQMELESRENVTILTNRRIGEKGIKGELGNFTLEQEDKSLVSDADNKPLVFDQVVQAAWQGGPEIMGQASQGVPGEDSKLTVYKRAMLLVRLPKGKKISPTFVMLGEHGGMLSSYNDDIAMCYLPTDEAAYIKSQTLSDSDPRLKDKNWDDLPESEEIIMARYFEKLKTRFPVLEGAEPIKLVIRDTLNFKNNLLEQRPDARPAEHMEVGGMVQGMFMSFQSILKMAMQLDQEAEPPQPPFELQFHKGVFSLYPTKATYSVNSALQVVEMVNERSAHPQQDMVFAPTEKQVLELASSHEGRARYSLTDMQVPDRAYCERFMSERGLPAEMMNPLTPPEPLVSPDSARAAGTRICEDR